MSYLHGKEIILDLVEVQNIENGYENKVNVIRIHEGGGLEREGSKYNLLFHLVAKTFG